MNWCVEIHIKNILELSAACCACCAGFKSSAVRKKYLPWHLRSYRITKTVFTSNVLSCLAEWTVTSYVDVYRQASTLPEVIFSRCSDGHAQLLTCTSGLHNCTGTVNSSSQRNLVCRMTKAGWREEGLPKFTKRLLLRLLANGVKTSVCAIGASLGEH